MPENTKAEDNLRAQKEHWDGCAKRAAFAEEERWRNLPPYNPLPRCEKCGSAPAKVTYRAPGIHQIHSSEDFSADTTGTMLHVCGYCSFQWLTKPIEVERRDGEAS